MSSVWRFAHASGRSASAEGDLCYGSKTHERKSSHLFNLYRSLPSKHTVAPTVAQPPTRRAILCYARGSSIRTAAAAADVTNAAPQAVPLLASTPNGAGLPANLLLSDIRVILVAPKHEANIGAVARACANFECLNLVLVAPRCAADGPEARKVACGDAVLDRLMVMGSLAEALADTAGSVGFTRRAGATRITHASLGHLLAEFPWAVPLQPPVQATLTDAGHGGQRADESAHGEQGACKEFRTKPAAEAEAYAEEDGEADAAASERRRSGYTTSSSSSSRRPIVTAMVFGREESGLTEAELRLCSHACAIPTGRVQPSMNLSHAAAVVLAEVFSRRCGLLDVASPAAVDEATAAMGADDRSQLLRVPPSPVHPVAHTHEGGLGHQRGAASTAGSGNLGGAPGAVAEGPAGLLEGAAAAESAGTAGSGIPVATARPVVPATGGGPTVDAGLLPASAQEVDLLVRKVAAVAEAVGMRGDEASGGGKKGNHGRRRLPVGHLRLVLSRARVSAAESRSLHGLASAVLQRLDPDHPLEARKRQRKLQQQQQERPPPPQDAGDSHGSEK